MSPTQQPDHETLYLSDAYMTKEAEISLELKVDILNINMGHNNQERLWRS